MKNDAMRLAEQVKLMHAAPRCGAHSRRTGKPCMGPAMANGRCRMHGGKSGAKPGNKNALKHGLYTKEAIEARRQTKRLIARVNDLIAQV